MKKPSKARQQLLKELESIVGASCFNGNIQNYGPGGEWEDEGRWFRYPLTYVDKDGEKNKVRHYSPEIPFEEYRTGYYAFGANQLQIVAALEKVLNFLETQHGLKITAPPTKKRSTKPRISMDDFPELPSQD